MCQNNFEKFVIWLKSIGDSWRDKNIRRKKIPKINCWFKPFKKWFEWITTKLWMFSNPTSCLVFLFNFSAKYNRFSENENDFFFHSLPFRVNQKIGYRKITLKIPYDFFVLHFMIHFERQRTNKSFLFVPIQ